MDEDKLAINDHENDDIDFADIDRAPNADQ